MTSRGKYLASAAALGAVRAAAAEALARIGED
jgi:hypothetical protein